MEQGMMLVPVNLAMATFNLLGKLPAEQVEEFRHNWRATIMLHQQREEAAAKQPAPAAAPAPEMVEPAPAAA